MKNKNTIITNSFDDTWRNFQRNLIPSPKCKGCDKQCTVLYDSHHDQYFSCTCGLVIMEMKCSLIQYKSRAFKRRGKKNKKKD